MTKIRITRPHRLGLEAARARAEEFTRTLSKELQLDYKWDGDRLTFERTGASGTLTIDASAIDLDIALGLPLSLLAGTIEKTIQERLDSALGQTEGS